MTHGSVFGNGLIAQPAAIASLKQVVKEATDFYSCYRCYRFLATFTYDLATHSTLLTVSGIEASSTVSKASQLIFETADNGRPVVSARTQLSHR